MKADAFKLPMTLLVLAASLLLSSASFGAEICRGLFSEGPAPYGTMKKTFVHNNTYKVELADSTEIKNQCALGTCHLHAWASTLENISLKNHGKNIKISTHYLSAMLWLSRSLENLNGNAVNSKEVTVNLGAPNMLASREIITRFGLVPDEAWTGARNFQDAQLSAKITEYVRNITARTKWAAEREIKPDAKKIILDTGKAQIIKVFADVLGNVPSKFIFEGKEHDQYSFAVAYFPEVMKPLTLMMVNPTRKAPTLTEDTPTYSVVVTNIDQVERATRDLLDKGISVSLAYEHNNNFMDPVSGVMSISAFSFPHEAAPLPRDKRASFGIHEGGHAVQIVGYDLNPATGRVLKWKIHNSWGDKVGDKGYFHMYNDYFRAYAMQITFPRDAGIVLPKAQLTLPQQFNLDLQPATAPAPR